MPVEGRAPKAFPGSRLFSIVDAKLWANSNLLVLHQAQTLRLYDCLGSAINTEFAINIAGVDLDRVQREVKPGSDLWIGQPFSDELQYL